MVMKCSVMVAQEILALLVIVRIYPFQLNIKEYVKYI